MSKALSRLLRHAAVQERIPIDSHGYVRMDHLLGWQKLRSMKPAVTFEEVVGVVEENEKKRFALKYVGGGSSPVSTRESGPDAEVEGQPEAETDAETETETQRAISLFQTLNLQDSLELQRFFVRATQGHSMKTIEAENLLTPITLDDPAGIPDTVVHGTFYGAWDRILHSGGLKAMTRNHVHFATGPALDQVLTRTGDDVPNTGAETVAESKANGKGKGKGKGSLAAVLTKNKVTSGMRSDAQILIYIDIRRALHEEKGMKWWRSENGVILTDGVVADGGSSDEAQRAKLVPSRYFLGAVEVKEGLGLLWTREAGVVQELPETLRNRAVPRGKGGELGGRGGGRGRGRGRGGDRGGG